jgi:hypothetical protein
MLKKMDICVLAMLWLTGGQNIILLWLTGDRILGTEYSIAMDNRTFYLINFDLI